MRKAVINTLEEMADIFEFKGENKFKISAFKNGANVLRNFQGNFEDALVDKSIEKIKGIGKGILSVIYDINDNGFSGELESLRNSIPVGITELFEIRGIGAKKVKFLNDTLDIQSIEQLEIACRENKIASLKGFGDKTQEKILEEISRMKSNIGLMYINKAFSIAEEIKNFITDFQIFNKIEISGELRRRREVIKKIEFVLLIMIDVKIEQYLSKIPNINDLAYISESFLEAFYSSYKIVFYITRNEQEFAETLFRTSADEGFLEKIKGRESGETVEEKHAEQGIGTYVIPEMREREYFLNRKLENSDLEFSKIKGLLHFHTNFSDGGNTLEEMINEAKILGFDYAAVCDHSKSAFYANGLSTERILEQHQHIAEVERELNFPIFKGIESDILKDGSLDYENDILQKFDFIVASVHSLFTLSEAEMTKRIIKAIENPFTDVLAHPTGRLLLKREGYKVDITKVIDACVSNRVAIEINANPMRLDLDWRNIFYAREKGCLFSINADAHSIRGINDTIYGIMMARKAGVMSDEVINFFNLEDFKKYLKRKK